MGKSPNNQKVKRKKVYLTFDENARKEYLTGFRKRRQERKAKAQHMLEKKLKDKIKQERVKRKKSTQEKVNKLLEGIRVPGDDDEVESEKCEKVDFGTHEVLVTTCGDFGESGLILAPSQDEVLDTKSQEKIKTKKKKTKVSEKVKQKKGKQKHKKKR